MIAGELAVAARARFGRLDVEDPDAAFSREFARYVGSAHAIPVSSGRRGLECILAGLGLVAGDEVIIPAYTLKDLAVRVSALGLKPVFADIDPDTFTMSPDAVERTITGRTKAVLATHMFGAPCHIDRIAAVARARGIAVIEDCAHALGADFNGRKLGSFGDAGFFSFETIKPLNLYGGGMIVTDDHRLADAIRKRITSGGGARCVPVKKIVSAYMERCFLPTPLSAAVLGPLSIRRFHRMMYGMYRLSQQCARSSSPGFTPFRSYLGLLKLKALDARIAARRETAGLLCSLLREPVRPQKITEGGRSNYYFFVVRVPGRVWQARRHLLAHGIDAGICQEIADDCAAEFRDAICPVTTGLYGCSLQLPLHEGMTEAQVRHIARTLNGYYS